ncbi:hypothetical protein ACQ24Z_004569, partial [Escherichia coli]
RAVTSFSSLPFLNDDKGWIRIGIGTKVRHTKLCIGLQSFACFSMLGRVSAEMTGYLIDFKRYVTNFKVVAHHLKA